MDGGGGGRRNTRGPIAFLRAGFSVLVLFVLVFVICRKDRKRKKTNSGGCKLGAVNGK